MRAPNVLLMVCVEATMLPSRSATVMCVVLRATRAARRRPSRTARASDRSRGAARAHSHSRSASRQGQSGMPGRRWQQLDRRRRSSAPRRSGACSQACRSRARDIGVCENVQHLDHMHAAGRWWRGPDNFMAAIGAAHRRAFDRRVGRRDHRARASRRAWRHSQRRRAPMAPPYSASGPSLAMTRNVSAAAHCTRRCPALAGAPSAGKRALWPHRGRGRVPPPRCTQTDTA